MLRPSSRPIGFPPGWERGVRKNLTPRSQSGGTRFKKTDDPKGQTGKDEKRKTVSLLPFRLFGARPSKGVTVGDLGSPLAGLLNEAEAKPLH